MFEIEAASWNESNESTTESLVKAINSATIDETKKACLLYYLSYSNNQKEPQIVQRTAASIELIALIEGYWKLDYKHFEEAIKTLLVHKVIVNFPTQIASYLLQNSQCSLAAIWCVATSGFVDYSTDLLLDIWLPLDVHKAYFAISSIFKKEAFFCFVRRICSDQQLSKQILGIPLFFEEEQWWIDYCNEKEELEASAAIRVWLNYLAARGRLIEASIFAQTHQKQEFCCAPLKEFTDYLGIACKQSEDPLVAFNSISFSSPHQKKPFGRAKELQPCIIDSRNSTILNDSLLLKQQKHSVSLAPSSVSPKTPEHILAENEQDLYVASAHPEFSKMITPVASRHVSLQEKAADFLLKTPKLASPSNLKKSSIRSTKAIEKSALKKIGKRVYEDDTSSVDIPAKAAYLEEESMKDKYRTKKKMKNMTCQPVSSQNASSEIEIKSAVRQKFKQLQLEDDMAQAEEIIKIGRSESNPKRQKSSKKAQRIAAEAQKRGREHATEQHPTPTQKTQKISKLTITKELEKDIKEQRKDQTAARKLSARASQRLKESKMKN